MPELHEAIRAVDADGDTERGRLLLEALAEDGDPGAAFLLGSLCLRGETPEDLTAAAIWFKRAAEGGHAAAAYNLGALYALGHGVSRDLAQAMRWYRRAADLGMAAAERMIGNMYGRGEGVDPDPVEGMRWIRRAAEHGDRDAMFQLARLLEGGVGEGDGAVEPDLPEAARWYLEAGAGEEGIPEAARCLAALAPHLQALAEDDPAAACRLGQLRRLGAGVPRDPAAAVALLRSAARAGNAEAAYELGGMYRDGDGVAPNPEIAVRLYTVAAEAGLAAAQHDLAWMLWTGTGCEQDWDQALRWYTASAEQGDAQSMFDVALALLAIDERATGEEAAPEVAAARRARAVEWLRRAAEGGWVAAMPMLGRAYLIGDGVGRDDVQAARWFMAGLMGGGSEGRAELRELASRLTPAQLREADRLAGGDGSLLATMLRVTPPRGTRAPERKPRTAGASA